MKSLHKIVFLLSLILQLGLLQGQVITDSTPLSTVSLEQCYQWTWAHYPAVAKLGLLEKSTQYSISNAAKGYLPQVSIQGQASYQSEVTSIPVEIPDLDIPTLDQDQYNAYAEVYQSLSNFSTLRTQKKQIALEGKIEQQKVEIELYQLKDRINQLYFGTLLIEVKIEQLRLSRTDIDTTLSRLSASLANGTASPLDVKLLEVEQINLDQQLKESTANRAAYLKMLATLSGQAIDTNTQLRWPSAYFDLSELRRPELQLYRMQSEGLSLQKQQINHRFIPELRMFFQGGYGRPALNFLSNEFSTYYVTGLKLSWNLSRLYTARKDKLKLGIQHQMIQKREETFLLNTTLTQSQQSQEISKYQQLIVSDKQALKLREEIQDIAEVQLINGLITTIDYVKILNDVSRERQRLALHEIMLLQSQYNLKTTTGN